MNIRKNIKKFFWDFSGAFGDIGVLFPISIILIEKNGFNPTAIFLFAGLFYLFSAKYFKITMPVQPLKAMAAIAIATSSNIMVINAAGIILGIILIIISVTGFSLLISKIFPLAVIRGIQLGLGLILIKTSLKLINTNFTIAVIAAIILIISLLFLKKIPPLIPLLIFAVIISFENIELSTFGFLPFEFNIPGIDSFFSGFIMLVIPQIALTFGNAIVATEATAKMLYKKRARKINLNNLPFSMGIANIIAGFFGGVPMCHGSGGLTAHSKFGATSEKSGYIIGIVLIVLALLFGHSLLSIISAVPYAIFGILLLYVGIQHSLFANDMLTNKLYFSITLITAIVGFIANNLTLGFIFGICSFYSIKSVVKIFKLKNIKI